MEKDFNKEMEAIRAAIRTTGMDPYEQLYGYVTEGKPEYITRTDNARERIQKLNRNKVREYVEKIQRKTK